MTERSAEVAVVRQARSRFLDAFSRDLDQLHEQARQAMLELCDRPAERQVAQQRQDLWMEFNQRGAEWLPKLREQLKASIEPGGDTTGSTLTSLTTLSTQGGPSLELVDDDTVHRAILESRLSLIILDKATWEFAELRPRLTQPFGKSDLDPDDILRPQVLARSLIRAWIKAGLSVSMWRAIEEALQPACANRAENAYREVNAWLTEQGMVQPVDLRALIRRADDAGTVHGLTVEQASDSASGPAGPTTGGGTASVLAGPASVIGAGMVAGMGMSVPGGVGSPMGAITRGAHPMYGMAQAGQASLAAQAVPVAGGGLRQGPLHAMGGFITRSLPVSLGGQGGPPVALTSPMPLMPASAPGAGVAEGGAAGYGSLGFPVITGSGVSGGISPDEASRMLTRMPDLPPMLPADLVLVSLSELVERQVPGFKDGGRARPPSVRLSQALVQVQHQVDATLPMDVEAAAPATRPAAVVVAGVAEAGKADQAEKAEKAQKADKAAKTDKSDPASAADGPAADAAAADAEARATKLQQDLREGTETLKKAAENPNERATIELVNLLFQSILTDDRIRPGLRIWFARLQMPTLRVALAEPDFFTSNTHPARRLIDRMGGCAMGFEGGADLQGTALETEIKRVVQVIEAFPDTGKRVFQTVLREFEKFLERYFREQNEKTRAGVSLAQQIEQRETLAIQYTIELRKMLNDVPVQDGVRDFLFHVWADVLATKAVRHGAQGEEVRTVRDAAGDLIWIASAKTREEDRAEVVRRLPGLLGTLRQGMTVAGLSMERQNQVMQALKEALTSAFSARASSIDPRLLEQLKRRLATIEEMLPDEDFELDDSWVLDEANHQRDDLEIIAEGGSMPSPERIAMASELALGSEFTLENRGRVETVRLVWQGMHRQLSLFVNRSGRCILFQKARLAAFLQAGLLIPIQEEALTVTATRNAMRQLRAKPSRLLA